MRLISLTQPWAALVAEGHKRFETRGWFTNYRGPLAIHATKGPPDMRALVRLSERYPKLFESLETLDEHGSIIATCEVVGCHLLHLKDQDGTYPWPEHDGEQLTAETALEGLHYGVTQQEVDFGDWRVGRFILDLQRARRVQPLSISRGSQGRPIPLDPAIEVALRYL